MTLDLSKVSYISSAGLRTMMRLHKKMSSKGGTFLLKNARKDAMDIFQVTGFINFLDVEGA